MIVQKISSNRIIIFNYFLKKHDAQYDFYGKRLATCSGDGTINVVDLSKPDNNVTRINTLEKLDNNKNTTIAYFIYSHITNRNSI